MYNFVAWIALKHLTVDTTRIIFGGRIKLTSTLRLTCVTLCMNLMKHLMLTLMSMYLMKHLVHKTLSLCSIYAVEQIHFDFAL